MKAKKFQKDMKNFRAELKKILKRLIVAKKLKNGKDFKNIRFESNYDLPMNKPMGLRLLTIIIRCVFSEGGSRSYPQLILDGALYELI